MSLFILVLPYKILSIVEKGIPVSLTSLSKDMLAGFINSSIKISLIVDVSILFVILVCCMIM